MLQKELAKRLKARYDTKMDGNGWLEVSSDGIPLCRIKYNGQFLSNADQNLSDEYRSKIADIQDEISTVREYVGLYEHAPQMKAADVSDYRQLAAFGDTVLAATYSEKNGFMFCTWKQNADGDSVFWGDYSPNYEYVKEAFAVRSGLVSKDRLFSENESAYLRPRTIPAPAHLPEAGIETSVSVKADRTALKSIRSFDENAPMTFSQTAIAGNRPFVASLISRIMRIA